MKLNKNEIEILLKKKKLSILELKKLATSIIDKITTEEELVIDFSPLTYVEYYRSNTFHKDLKLEKGGNKLKKFIVPLSMRGFYLDNKIVLFIDNFKKSFWLASDYNLIDLIVAIFHETGHAHQKQKIGQYSYFQIITKVLEEFIRCNDINHYDKYWSLYNGEIMANLYAINKTEELLSEYPDVLEVYKEDLDKKKERFDLISKFYDFDFIFEKFHSLNKEDTNRQDLYGLTMMLYYPNSSKFRSILELKDKFNFRGDQEVFLNVISTKSFINQLDYSKLSNEEIDAMISAVLFKLEKEREKRNYLMHLNIDNDKFLEGIPTIYDIEPKIKFLELTLLKLRNYKFNLDSKNSDITYKPYKTK